MLRRLATLIVTLCLSTAGVRTNKAEILADLRAVAWQATRVPLEPKQEAPVNLTPGATARPGLEDEIRQADDR